MAPTEQYKFIHVFIVFSCCSMSCSETNIDITILNIERERFKYLRTSTTIATIIQTSIYKIRYGLLNLTLTLVWYMLERNRSSNISTGRTQNVDHDDHNQSSFMVFNPTPKARTIINNDLVLNSFRVITPEADTKFRM